MNTYENKKNIFTHIVSGLCCIAFFQPGANHAKQELYEVWVSISIEPGRLEGILFEVKYSSILISDPRIRNQYLSGNFNVPEIDFKNLETQLIMTEVSVEKTGSGFAINPGASFKYNIARRWVLIAKAEYIYSNPKELDFNSLQTFNLGFGAGYRFR